MREPVPFARCIFLGDTIISAHDQWSRTSTHFGPRTAHDIGVKSVDGKTYGEGAIACHHRVDVRHVGSFPSNVEDVESGCRPSSRTEEAPTTSSYGWTRYAQYCA